MSYLVRLSADELEDRLLKSASTVYTGKHEKDNDIIKVNVNTGHNTLHKITHGSELRFTAPCDCTKSTRLCLTYKENLNDTSVSTRTFAFAAADGNRAGEIDNLFKKDAIVSVLLDFKANNGKGAAFVQNAATSAYLEDALSALKHNVEATTGRAQVIVKTWEDTDQYDANKY